MAAFPAANITIEERVPHGTRWYVYGRVTGVTTTGGHIPKETLGLSKIDMALVSGEQAIGFNSGVRNSQSATPDQAGEDGDLFIDTAAATAMNFVALGRSG